tara:strand:- start:161 stop:574 length:414 start_codon:yes stop_codon:yes gene_type:complete
MSKLKPLEKSPDIQSHFDLAIRHLDKVRMIMRESILHNNSDIKNIDEIDKLIMDVFLLQIKCKRGGVYVQKEKLDQGRNQEAGSVQEESQESKDVHKSIRKESDEEEEQGIPEDEETGSFSVNLNEDEKVINKKYDT